MKLFCDLDGTLLDVSARNYRVYSEVCKIFGGTPLEKTVYWQEKRKKAKWPQLLPMSKLPAEIEKDFLDEFIKKVELIDYLHLDTLYDGALTTLDRVAKSYECYLVSLRRNRTNLLLELEWLDLAKHFTRVLTGHSENDGYDVKIELIKSEYRRDEDGIIVGDTEADIVTGHELGMKTIAVSSGIRDPGFLTALKPDYLLDDFTQIESVLHSLA